VRDLLLETPTLDIDFVVEGDAVALTRALRRQFGGEMRSHARFGTGKWMIDPATWDTISDRLNTVIGSPGDLPPHIDFVSARAEFYEAPTMLPTVETGNIKLDLHRRDFTINTLAIRLDPHRFGQLLDFYEGERDLHAGVIRVLHSLSFIDDPTRILRAVRLEQRLDFQIEARTEELIADAVPLLDRVSGDRIRHEIELILVERRPENAFRRLDALGVLATIHPDLHWDEWMVDAFARLRSGLADPVWPELAGVDSELPYFSLLTYHLPVSALDAVCKRIRVKRRTVDVLHEIARIRRRIDLLEMPQKPSQVDEVLHKATENVLVTLWAAALNDTARDQIADYARRLRHISPVTDGTALKEMGLQPGPVFGRILKRLRTAWLDGEISTPEQEQTLLRHLLGQEMA
jgi:tRNA nucleotidyltransferase (CCA-adding enzyme)